jgi:hypothetical protein
VEVDVEHLQHVVHYQHGDCPVVSNTVAHLQHVVHYRHGDCPVVSNTVASADQMNAVGTLIASSHVEKKIHHSPLLPLRRWHYLDHFLWSAAPAPWRGLYTYWSSSFFVSPSLVADLAPLLIPLFWEMREL